MSKESVPEVASAMVPSQVNVTFQLQTEDLADCKLFKTITQEFRKMRM